MKTTVKDRIGRWLAKSFGLDQFARMWLAGSVSSGQTPTTDAYRWCVWVAKCIEKIASAASSLPVQLTDAEDNVITSGPIVDFVRRPNEKMTWRKFVFETIGHYLLWGEADWLVEEWGPDLAPRRVAVVGKNDLTPLRRESEVTAWELRLPGGAKKLYLAGDVVQIKRWNPYDSLRGLSITEAIQQALGQNRRAGEFNTALLDNTVVSGGVMSAPEISDEQEKQIEAMLERRSGVDNAGRPMILSGGLSWVDTTKDLAKMQHLELTKYSREELVAAFDTTLPMLGILEYANYANMEACQELWYYNALVPACELVGTEFTESFGRRFGDCFVWINHEAHPIAGKLKRSSIGAGKTMFDMGVPFEDIDKWMNWGLPERPWHKIGWRPLGLVPADSPIDLGPEIADEQNAEQPAAASQQSEPASRASAVEEVVKNAIWNRWKVSWAPLERRFAGRMKRFFFEQRRGILERLDRAAGGESKAQGPEPKALSEANIISILFDVLEEKGRLRAIVEPLYRQAITFGAHQAIAEVSSPAPFTQTDPAVLRIMRRKWPKLAGVTDEIAAAVRDQLTEGIQANETIAELAQRVREYYKPFSGDRAMRIARTETASCVSSGRFEGMKKAGVERKSWLSRRIATGPGRVREAHLAADRQYTANPIPITDAFIVGGERLMHPGDPAGSAGNIINCACCLLAETSERAVVEYYAAVKFLTVEEWMKKELEASHAGNR